MTGNSLTSRENMGKTLLIKNVGTTRRAHVRVKYAVEDFSDTPSRGVRLLLIGSADEFGSRALEFLKSDKGGKFIRDTFLEGLAKAIEMPVAREGRLQARIPADLDRRFKAVADRLDAKRTELLTEQLSQVFKMQSGRRIKARPGPSEVRSFKNPKQLLERARILNRDRKKVKFAYVCGSAKVAEAIEFWAKEKGISVAGLFSALIERICDEHEGRAPKPEANEASGESQALG